MLNSLRNYFKIQIAIEEKLLIFNEKHMEQKIIGVL